MAGGAGGAGWRAASAAWIEAASLADVATRAASSRADAAPEVDAVIHENHFTAVHRHDLRAAVPLFA